jgi:hypothetical protein
MNERRLLVELDREHGMYSPGDVLTVFCRVLEELRVATTLEVTVSWRTEGKGSEEKGVHHQQRLALGKSVADPSQPPACCQVRLPNSPLSYDGALFKIHWRVHINAWASSGVNVVREIPFLLGDVAPAVRVKL